MARQLKMIVLLCVLYLGGIFFYRAPVANAADWTEWACGWAVLNYPVTGGTMSGRGCAQWWTGAELRWAVWGDTYAPTPNYATYTSINGYDSCDGGLHWTLHMQTFHYDYNTAYGTSGRVEGYYLDCSPGSTHVYKTVSSHWRERTSGSSWEAKSGTVLH